MIVIILQVLSTVKYRLLVVIRQFIHQVLGLVLHIGHTLPDVRFHLIKLTLGFGRLVVCCLTPGFLGISFDIIDSGINSIFGAHVINPVRIYVRSLGSDLRLTE